MSTSLIAHLGDPTSFLDTLFSDLHTLGIDCDELELDHICYRVETRRDYIGMYALCCMGAKLIDENPINGRMIAVFRLREPIRYNGREIWILELPAPKEGSHYPNGLEHVEFVIDDFGRFMACHPDVDFDRKGLAKHRNADLRLKLPSGASVKFHLKPLEDVIADEQAERE